MANTGINYQPSAGLYNANSGSYNYNLVNNYNPIRDMYNRLPSSSFQWNSDQQKFTPEYKNLSTTEKVNDISGVNDAGGLAGIFNMDNIGKLGSLAGNIGSLIGGIGGILNGRKAMKLAKEQFAFQKGLANRNLFNEAKMINNAYDNAAQVTAGLIGGAVDSNGYTSGPTQETINQQVARANKQHVNGSAIG